MRRGRLGSPCMRWPGDGREGGSKRGIGRPPPSVSGDGTAAKARVVSPYARSSAFYDRLVGKTIHEHWRENFERLERRYGLRLETVADVACGTGLASRYLAERGCRVYAVDISPQMLRLAAYACNGGRGKVCFLRQDMRYLGLPRRVDTLVCASDSLNHLLREEDVRLALCSFRRALREGGHALFDVNTEWQLREGADEEPWDFLLDGVPIRWVSSWDEESMTATLYMCCGMGKGGGPGGVVEVHRERAYDRGWLEEELRRAGFGRVEALDAAGLGKPGPRTRRLQFVAVRE